MTSTDFLDALARDVPESQPLVEEHLKDNDELLLHLLTADLRRFAVQSFDAGQSDVLQRLLALVDAARSEGADDLENAIAVSFVEDTGWWDPATQPFIDAWPTGLQAEVERQRSWRPRL